MSTGIKELDRVKTTPKQDLERPGCLAYSYWSNRRSDEGLVIGEKAGFGGDLWLVRHEDGKYAVYTCDEMEVIP